MRRYVFLICLALISLASIGQKRTGNTVTEAPPSVCPPPQANVFYVTDEESLHNAIAWANCVTGLAKIVVCQNISLTTAPPKIRRSVLLVGKARFLNPQSDPSENTIISVDQGTDSENEPEKFVRGFLFSYENVLCGGGGGGGGQGAPGASNPDGVTKETAAKGGTNTTQAENYGCMGLAHSNLVVPSCKVEGLNFDHFQPYAVRFEHQGGDYGMQCNSSSSYVRDCKSSSAFQFYNCKGVGISGNQMNLAYCPLDQDCGAIGEEGESFNGSGIEIEHCEQIMVCDNRINRPGSPESFQNFRCGDFGIRVHCSGNITLLGNHVGTEPSGTYSPKNKFEAGIQLIKNYRVRVEESIIYECYAGITCKQLVVDPVHPEFLHQLAKNVIGANAKPDKSENCLPAYPQCGIWVGPGNRSLLITGNHIEQNEGHGIAITNPELDRLCLQGGYSKNERSRNPCTGEAAEEGTVLPLSVQIEDNHIGGEEVSSGNKGHGIYISYSDSSLIWIGSKLEPINKIRHNGEAGIGVYRQKNVLIGDENDIYDNDRNLIGKTDAENKRKAIRLAPMACAPYDPGSSQAENEDFAIGNQNLKIQQVAYTGGNGGLVFTFNTATRGFLANNLPGNSQPPCTLTLKRIDNKRFCATLANIPLGITFRFFKGDTKYSLHPAHVDVNGVFDLGPDEHIFQLTATYYLPTFQQIPTEPTATSTLTEWTHWFFWRNRFGTSANYSIDLSEYCRIVTLHTPNAALCEGELGEVTAAITEPDVASSFAWGENGTSPLPTPPLPYSTEQINQRDRFQFLMNQAEKYPLNYKVTYQYHPGANCPVFTACTDGTGATGQLVTEIPMSVWKYPVYTLNKPIPVSCSGVADGRIQFTLGDQGGLPAGRPTGYRLYRLTSAGRTLLSEQTWPDLFGGPAAPTPPVTIKVSAIDDAWLPGGVALGKIPISEGDYQAEFFNGHGCLRTENIHVGINLFTVSLDPDLTGYVNCGATPAYGSGPTPQAQVAYKIHYAIPTLDVLKLYACGTNPNIPGCQTGTFDPSKMQMVLLAPGVGEHVFPIVVGGLPKSNFSFTYSYNLPVDNPLLTTAFVRYQCPDDCNYSTPICTSNVALPASSLPKPELKLNGQNPGTGIYKIYKCGDNNPIELKVDFSLSPKNDPLNTGTDQVAFTLTQEGQPVTLPDEPSGWVPVSGNQITNHSLSFTGITSTGNYILTATLNHYKCAISIPIEVYNYVPEITFDVRPQMCFNDGDHPDQKGKITAHVSNLAPFGVEYQWRRKVVVDPDPDPDLGFTAIDGATLPELIVDEAISPSGLPYRFQFVVTYTGTPPEVPSTCITKAQVVSVLIPGTTVPYLGVPVVKLPDDCPSNETWISQEKKDNTTLDYCGLALVNFEDNEPRFGYMPEYEIYWYQQNCITSSQTSEDKPPGSDCCNCPLNPDNLTTLTTCSGTFESGGRPGNRDCLLGITQPTVEILGFGRKLNSTFSYEYLEDGKTYYAVLYDKRSMCHTYLGSMEYVKPKPVHTYSLCLRWGYPDPPKGDDVVAYSFLNPLSPSDLTAPIEAFKGACAGKRAEVNQQLLAGMKNDPGTIKDQLSIKYKEPTGHYTLYYHDRAGNLIKTVPPKGVNHGGNGIHAMATTYQYNTTKELEKQETPEAKITTFRYLPGGLLRYSQNALQLAQNKYSYTTYDELKRIVEVGEVSGTMPTEADTDPITETARTEYVHTVYDAPCQIGNVNLRYFHIAGQEQKHLTNRVSYTQTQNGHVTAYSYDAHGNVEWIYQFFEQMPGDPVLPTGTSPRREHWVRYEYDLISGKVLKVALNEHRNDRFFHRYQYDEDNRLTVAETSTDELVWEQDASYRYYPHGPLKQVQLGQEHVQTLDYTYTLQGWLKNINPTGSQGTGEVDDQLSSGLTYFDGDDATNLYNGNIKKWTTRQGSQAQPMVQNFRYDVLNRLMASSTVENGLANNHYGTSYTYDPNGNLKTLNRAASTPDGQGVVDMDALDYRYTDGDGNDFNQLQTVSDLLNEDNTPGYQDIKGQQTAPYKYDAIGNLIEDPREGLAITWNAFGKIQTVNHVDAAKPDLTFGYDAGGNRIYKRVVYSLPSDICKNHIDWYVRDAAGNTMAVYRETMEKNPGVTPCSLDVKTHTYQTEVLLYGSDRLGTYRPGNLEISLDWVAALPDPIVVGMASRGRKQYELKDHLGNVRVTVGDQLVVNGKPVVGSNTEYYPFGMEMPGRANPGENGVGTRYGFNGHEKDDEIKGSGNHLSFGDYGYDPRIGRRWNVEPLIKKYPYLSSYVVFANSPILYTDPDGNEIVVPNVADREPILKMINARALGTFAFDKNGKLYQVSAKGDASRYSKYYADKLVAAINDKTYKIEVLIGNDIKGATLNADGKTMDKDKGAAQNVDAESGGGVTFCGPKPGTDQVVYISGNENKTLTDTKGNPLRDEAADILAHELVGHAIPWTAVGTDTGNAVENENKVRKEYKEKGQVGESPLRAPEPGHTE